MEPNAPDTSNFLDWVEIKNFKSIKALRLDCKRVNVFIGKPNVGKSNILEALGMLGADLYNVNFMKGGVRYKTLKHLFYQNDNANNISVTTNKSSAFLWRNEVSRIEYHYAFLNDATPNEQNRLALNPAELVFTGWDNNTGYFSTYREDGLFVLTTKDDETKPFHSKIKKYDFAGITDFTDSFLRFLSPNGDNLFATIDRRKDLKNEFGKLFLEQGLDLVLDQENQSFTIQRRDGFYIYKYEYYTIADTFRRFMFYIAAIESNESSVLIFEEPEVHSFPPYTQELAYRMINDTDNQYFISTHSPYMLHPFIEKMDYKDLNIFITYYEDYQTRVKALDYEEFRDILDYSTNVFFNLNHFTPNATNKVAP